MTQKTVMEKADEILANMGISDAAPLSESTSDSVNSVGKNYDNQELPGLSDEQRLQLLEHSGFISEARKKDEDEDEDEDPVGDEEEEVPRDTRDTSLDVDDIKVPSPNRTRNRRMSRKAKLAKKAKTPVDETTTVGMVGIGPLGNSPADDPDKPHSKKKDKKKKRRSTLNFIDLAFKR